MAKSIKTLMAGLAITAVATVGLGLLTAKPALADGCVDVPNGTGGTQQYCGPLMMPPSSVSPHPAVGYDRCYLEQNALRPCTSGQQQQAMPTGVTPVAVGTWDFYTGHGQWVLQVFANGTYRFHSEARDGVAASAGQFSASNGNWMLKGSDGYTDGGSYTFRSRDIWIATGSHGTAAWIRRS